MGVLIERHFPSGMFYAFVPGRGYPHLKADTLYGIRLLIREALRDHTR